jgi:hypothetical protein
MVIRSITVVDRRDDIDDDWGDRAEPSGERPSVSNAAVAEGGDKIDTAKNRLARIDEHVRIDPAEEAAPISRPSLPTVPPPSGYDEVRRTSKRQAFDLDAALERRGLRDGGVPPPDSTPMPLIPPAPPSSSPFFAAGHLPPLPSTQAPPTLIDVVRPPPRPIAPLVAVAIGASAVAIGIAVYAIAMVQSAPPAPVLASASVAPPPPPSASPLPTVEPIVPAVIDPSPEQSSPPPAVPAPMPSPRITATTAPSAPPSAPPAPKPSAPSAPAPAHTPSATSTAAPGVEFLKRNL